MLVASFPFAHLCLHRLWYKSQPTTLHEEEVIIVQMGFDCSKPGSRFLLV